MLPRSPPEPLTQRICLGLAVERVDLVELGAGVAAAEVGDAQVGAEQVGAVAQELRAIEFGGDGLIPFVFQKLKSTMRCHDADPTLSLWLKLPRSSFHTLDNAATFSNGKCPPTEGGALYFFAPKEPAATAA